MSVVGIDFGNSSCVIAVAQKGGIDVITNDVSNRQTPCMVAFGERERYLGESASTQHLRNIKNTINNFKRLLGRKYDEPDVQEEMKTLPFKCIKLEDGTVGVEVMYNNEKKTFSVTAVTGMLLQKLKETTENATQKPCVDVVIGVPGWWNDRQRRALLDASKIAGLNALRLMNEITATALSWGIYKTNMSETEPTYVLFYDMGQSQTSVAVVEYLKGKLRIVSSAYDRNLGGRNFDAFLVEHFVNEFKAKYKIDIRSNQKALIRLEVACEKLKKVLNTVPEAPINVDSIMNDIDVRGMMKRADLEALFHPLLPRVIDPVVKAVSESGIPLEKISAIEISGGGTRLVPVQNMLTEYFKRDLSKTQNFEETVCRGCALQCAILSPVFKVREFSIQDISLYPIKFTWKTPGKDSMVEDKDSAEVFTKNNPIPSPKMITMHRTEGVELSAIYSDTSLLPEGTDPLIGKFVIASLPITKAEPAKIRVKVKLDLHGIVNVEGAEMTETVEEAPKEETEATSPMQTEEKKEETASASTEEKKEKKKVTRTNLTVTEHTSSISKKELESLTEQEGKMIAADRLSFETAEKKNAVESYIYEMRDKLSGSLAEFVSQQDKEPFLKLLESTQDWLYGEGEDVTKSVYSKKLDELKALGDPIVKRNYEYEHRFDQVNTLKNSISTLKLNATSADPKYDHISQEEKNKIVAECDSVEKWLSEKVLAQEKLSKHVNPAFTVAEVHKKTEDLVRMANAILNKPKPAPPKKEEPKKEEAKKEEPKPEEKKEEEEPKKEEKEMDLD